MAPLLPLTPLKGHLKVRLSEQSGLPPGGEQGSKREKSQSQDELSLRLEGHWGSSFGDHERPEPRAERNYGVEKRPQAERLSRHKDKWGR